MSVSTPAAQTLYQCCFSISYFQTIVIFFIVPWKPVLTRVLVFFRIVYNINSWLTLHQAYTIYRMVTLWYGCIKYCSSFLTRTYLTVNQYALRYGFFSGGVLPEDAVDMNKSEGRNMHFLEVNIYLRIQVPLRDRQMCLQKSTKTKKRKTSPHIPIMSTTIPSTRTVGKIKVF